jgi:hypothetical protein
VRLLLFLAVLAPLLAQAPLPDWNERQVLRTVTDSPWARRAEVRLTWRKEGPRIAMPRDIPGADPVRERTGGGLGPLGGIGAPPKDKLPYKAELIFRWASALPVRQAKAIFTKSQKPLGEFGDGYTFEIFGMPAEIAHMGAESVEALAQEYIVLRTKSGRLLKPNGAEARILGTSLNLFVHFPRTEPLTAADEFIQIDGDLQVFRFSERFLLKKMEYGGKLEL